jgi:transposase
MDVLHERCCGLDIHKRTVVACRIVPGPAGRPAKEVRTFGTMSADLLELADWLAEGGVTHVGMESTGVYWQPIWNVLEEREFALVLANARHIKAVPGRKTDVRDCEWIADLLRHGLLPASLVPDRAGRERRELTRYRTSLVQERSAEANRLQKTLEGANIKLAAVASDVLGASGRAMLMALVGGTTDPDVVAELARGQLRDKLPALQRALAGRFGPHQRFLVAQQLAHIDALDRLIGQLDAELQERLRPFEAALALLDTIPGVGRRTAEILVAELGPDMRRFPSARHLASWAGLCPGNHQSAGKRTSGRTRKGSKWLRSALVEAAQAAGRTKDTYLGAQHRRWAARLGKRKAAVATGHAILQVAYYLLARNIPYHDLGLAYFEQRNRAALERTLVRRLEALGNTVTLQPQTPAA